MSQDNKQSGDECFRFLLFGGTGSGKSTTGNTILGENLFKTSSTFFSVTSDCQKKVNSQRGIKFEIVESPGLYDTNKSEAEVYNLFDQAAGSLPPGPDAILYVIRIGRYTEGDFKAYQIFRDLLGDHIDNGMVVVFTGADVLEREGLRMEDLLGQDIPPLLQQVLTDCKNRYVVLNNMAPYPWPQVERLLQIVREMKQKTKKQPGLSPKQGAVFEITDIESGQKLLKSQDDKADIAGQMYFQELIRSLRAQSLQNIKIPQEFHRQVNNERTSFNKLVRKIVMMLEKLQRRLEMNDDLWLQQMSSKRIILQHAFRVVSQLWNSLNKGKTQDDEKERLKTTIQMQIKQSQETRDYFHQLRKLLENIPKILRSLQRQDDESDEKWLQLYKLFIQVELAEECPVVTRRSSGIIKHHGEQYQITSPTLTRPFSPSYTTRSRSLDSSETAQGKHSTKLEEMTARALQETLLSLTYAEKMSKELQKKESITNNVTEQLKNEDEKRSADVAVETTDVITVLETLTLVVHPISMQGSASSPAVTAFSPNDPKESLASSLLKVSSITEQNLLSSYSATQQTQTDDDPHKRNIDKPVFCEQWQVRATFTSTGGSLTKPRSDVVLTVPSGAIEKGAYRDLYMGVCTDISHIHSLLNVPDIYIASPVAEFWAGARDSATFDKPVQIYLPHCLTLPDDLDLVQVYRVSTDARGKVTLQLLLRDPHNEQTSNEGADSSRNGSFYVSSDGRICITTTSFSAYVCVRCKHSNSRSPEVFVVGCGTNNHQPDGLSTGFVSVAVWDRRLTVTDFQPTNAVSKPRKLTLPVTSSNGKPYLGLELRLGVSNSKPIWQHICFNSGESAPYRKLLGLREILHCAGPDCQSDPDQSTAWQLETTQPCETAPLLRCLIVITYLPQGDTMGDCSTGLGDVVMDIAPGSETSAPKSNTAIPIVQVIRRVEQMVVHGGNVQTPAICTPEQPEDLGSSPPQLPLPRTVSTENENTDP